jgi:hypothetical protein
VTSRASGHEDRLRRASPALEARGLDRQALARRVLAAGGGSLSSCSLEILFRLGIAECVAVDFDVVDDKDVVQAAFQQCDIGRPKVEALRDLGARLGSPTRVVPMVEDVRRLGAGVLRDFDLVISGVDTLGARLALYAEVYAAGVPLVDGGIDGHDGRVTEIAAAGACFACASGGASEAAAAPWGRLQSLSARAVGCRAAADPAASTIAAPYATREVASVVAARALHVLAGKGASQELRLGFTPEGVPRWRRFDLRVSAACGICRGRGFDPGGSGQRVHRLTASAARDSLARIERLATQDLGPGSLERPPPWSAFDAQPPEQLWSGQPAAELGVPLGGRLAYQRASGERCSVELVGDALPHREGEA